MAERTVPVSVRLSQDDVSFLASLEIQGAKTPSEKLRALITQARAEAEQPNSFNSALSRTESQYQQLRNQIKAAELSSDTHSEIMTLMLDWLPEVQAMLKTVVIENHDPSAHIKELEYKLVTRMLRLLETFLRYAITPSCPCYDQKIITKEITPLLELAKIVIAAHSNMEGNT